MPFGEGTELNLNRKPFLELLFFSSQTTQETIMMILLKMSQDEQTLTFLVQNNRTGLDNFTRDLFAWEQLVSSRP